MLLRNIPIDKIIPHPNNPRVTLNPKDPEYRQIKESLDVYGYVMPLIWNEKSGFLISGHQRFPLLVAQGLREIEVVVVSLGPEEEKGLMIAINKISGRWDKEKLAVILEEFTKVPDFNFDSIGFSSPEISQILDLYGESKDGDDFDFESVLDSVEEPITKKGDIILLGTHRLICGDATSETDISALLGNEKIDLVDLDWPYNVNLYGGRTPRNDTRPKKGRKWERIYNDDMPQKEYETFMRKVLLNIKTHLKPGSVFYQWQAHKQLGPLYQILDGLGFYISCLICWTKESAAISYADYSFQTEQAVYGWLKGESHYFAGKPGESNLWQVKRDPTKSYFHPCQKPVVLAERAIRNSSKQNDVVLDVFLGSGSVLIASEILKRRCFGMELDPKFCDAIVKRYIYFVGREKVSKELVQKYLKENSNDRK